MAPDFRSLPGSLGLLLRIAPLLLLWTACIVNDQQAAPESPDWTVIGPGGGGAQFIPTISPHDPNHVFVRCDMTGAYVTWNGGGKWLMFNLGGVVQDFEFDPHVPNVVYAGTSALFRSEDGGHHWRMVFPGPDDVVAETMSGDHASQRFLTAQGPQLGQIGKIRVDPEDANTLYIGITPERGVDACRIQVSRDRGTTWTQLAEIPGNEIFTMLPGAWTGSPGALTVITDRGITRIPAQGAPQAMKPPFTGRILDADGGFSKGAGGRIYLMNRPTRESSGITGGLFVSRDGGTTWEDLAAKLTAGFSEESPVPVFETLAVSEGNPDTVFLSTPFFPVRMEGSLQIQSGILKTSDGGRNWDWKLAVCGGTVVSDNFTGGWILRQLGWFRNPSHLGVGPNHPQICYGTDSGRTFHTMDGGDSWEQLVSRDFRDGSAMSRGLDVTTTYGVHFDPFDRSHLFITYTDIGLFHSWDGGESWHHAIAGIPRQWRNTCYWMVFDPEVRGRIWSVWSNVHDLPRPKMHRSGNLVNGNRQGGVAVSGDSGRWWELCGIGVLEDGDYRRGLPFSSVCTHITLDPKSPVRERILYVCEYGRGVYKSSDGGRTWDLKTNGLGPNRQAWRTLLLPSGRLLLLVARGGLEGQGYLDGALYESLDGAESWSPLSLPAGVNAPNDLVFDPSTPDRLYLCSWPYTTMDGTEKGGGVYRSEDGGLTWKPVFDERAHVYAAAVHPEHPETVFINTFNGAALRSDDRGETWKVLQGYDFKWGHRPVIDPRDPETLFLTTFGGSVFRGPARGVPESNATILTSPKKTLVQDFLE